MPALESETPTLGLDDGELILRLKTRTGIWYEMSCGSDSVFDVDACAGIFSANDDDLAERPAEPAAATKRGVVFVRQDSSVSRTDTHNLLDPRVEIITDAKGLWVPGPITDIESAGSAITDLTKHRPRDFTETRTYTFCGAAVVEAALDTLRAMEDSRAARLWDISALAINYAQRQVPN